MMSVEDRVRAATQARADLVRDIPPLDLPHDVAEFRLAKPRRTGFRAAWLTPLAAAALVVALVAVQLVVRQSVSPGTASQPTTSAASGSPPRYYVALSNPVPGAGSPEGTSVMSNQVTVGDDHTGRSLTTVAAPAGLYFTAVTAEADDRTFVLSTYQAATRETAWYQLRVTPGAAHPAKLARLPIEPQTVSPDGLAVSPDGRTLAVMTTADLPKLTLALTLRSYSLKSGAVLGQWTTNDDSGWYPTEANDFDLSWSADSRHLTFKYITHSDKPDKALVVQARTLDVTASGSDLLAVSRVGLQVPQTLIKDSGQVTFTPCTTLRVTTDGSAVVCGSQDSGSSKTPACQVAPATITSYPLATGKSAKVRYQYAGKCWNVTTTPLWANSTASEVLGFLEVVPFHGHVSYQFGLFASGRFTPLPALALKPGAIDVVTDDFSNIAF